MNRIFDPSLSWTEGNVPVADAFGDVYYSKADGLDETRTVFLDGNALPHAWRKKRQFTIAETGFGTGLNFLATCKLFEESCTNGERLDFISVEQYPMKREDIARALGHWQDELGAERIRRLIDVYPMRIPGFHRRWISDRVTLTLIFDDALRGFKQLDTPVDAWFLDGFSPAKNETLWQQELFTEMARLSHAETTLGSFTAAGHVRRGLEQVGFSIERVAGHGYKRHRITGKFVAGNVKPVHAAPPASVTIAGAGLAGAGVAHALRRRGIDAHVYDQADSLGHGASGNQLGLINPKLEAQDNPKNDAGLSAFSFATHILSDLRDIDYTPSGALHLGFTPDKAERLEKLVQSASFLAPHLEKIPVPDSTSHSGMALPYDGVFFADAASVNTRKLVAALLESATLHFNQEKNDADILACGWGLHTLFPDLPLQPVRGQVTFINAPHSDLKYPVMFGSYIAPTQNGTWSIGATFDRDRTDTAPCADDDARNLDALKKVTGMEAEPIGSWANIRTATRDRFPIVGTHDGRYVIGGLGSHGIQFGLLLGEIVACLMTNAPLPIGHDALAKLSVDRFV